MSIEEVRKFTSGSGMTNITEGITTMEIKEKKPGEGKEVNGTTDTGITTMEIKRSINEIPDEPFITLGKAVTREIQVRNPSITSLVTIDSEQKVSESHEDFYNEKYTDKEEEYLDDIGILPSDNYNATSISSNEFSVLNLRMSRIKRFIVEED